MVGGRAGDFDERLGDYAAVDVDGVEGGVGVWERRDGGWVHCAGAES